MVHRVKKNNTTKYMTLTELIYNSVPNEVLHASDDYDSIVWKHITEEGDSSLYTLNPTSYSGTEIKYTNNQYVSEQGNVVYGNMITVGEYEALDQEEKENWEVVKKFYGRTPIPISEMETILNNYLLDNSWKTIRNERNKRLLETDKYTIPDWPHPTPEAKQAWLDYRQALRDLPANTTDPENPVWPQAPQ